MRIIAIDQTDGVLRVAYRWESSLFEPPRLLIEGSPLPLADMRRVLERDHLGGVMQAADYRIVVLLADQVEYDTVQTAFAGFEVIGIRYDDPYVAVLASWIDPTDHPSDRVMALTYWGADQIDFGGLFDHFARGFLHWEQYAKSPDTFRTDLSAIRASSRVMLIGRTTQALRETYQHLIGSALSVPVVPGPLLIGEVSYEGLPLTVFDGRDAMPVDSVLTDSVLIILAIASDPGLGAADMALLSSSKPMIVAIVNTHADPGDYAAVCAYLRSELSAVARVIEVTESMVVIRAALGAIIRNRLLGWLAAQFPTVYPTDYANMPDDLKRSIQQAHRTINQLGLNRYRSGFDAG
jgi:hypothetical protein